VLERLGPDRIHTGHRLVAFEERGERAVAHFERPADGVRVEVEGEALVGADGIHSALRASFYPDEGPPAWNGYMIWRGAVDWPVFADGRTLVIAGTRAAKDRGRSRETRRRGRSP
jgi:5-methylphenazine-1-carboxylate 1-monooxygenase